jgi:hypothetical protein
VALSLSLPDFARLIDGIDRHDEVLRRERG